MHKQPILLPLRKSDCRKWKSKPSKSAVMQNQSKISETHLIYKYNAHTTYSFHLTEERSQEMQKQAVKTSGNAESNQNIRNTSNLQLHNLTNEEEIELLRQLQNPPGVRYCEKVNQKITPPPYD